MIRAGAFDRRVTIQQATETRDAAGEPVATWSTLAEVSAARLKMMGRERVVTRQEFAEEWSTYRIRYRSDVTAKMRLVDGSKTFDIEGVTEGEGRGRSLLLDCRAVVP